MNYKFNSGDTVIALRGPNRSMNPEPHNVGRVGIVVAVGGHIGNMPYYLVRFRNEDDCIDESNLGLIRRARS